MQRVLEPEYMDTEVEAEGYDQMDHSAANAAVVERFLAIGGGRCRRVVDLGTGPGDIPILLARQCAGTAFVGVDAAATMLALARRKIRRHGLGARIRFVRADVKALPFADGAFDGVFSNTILHHIPDPLQFLIQAARVLAAGGRLLIRDLYRPPTLAESQRLVDLHARDATPPQRQLLLQSLCAALTLDEARDCARAAGLQRASVEMSSDRHYTIEWTP
jgi:ubiquinone/menaquinone biosynthesis C-methylase UbiE